MKPYTIFAVAVALAAGGAAARADSLDINLNNESIQATYAAELRAAEFNVGALYNDDRDDWVVSMGIVASGEGQGGTRTEAGLGGKIYGASVDNQDLLALGLGGQFRVFPGNGPVGIGAYGFYAPDIVTGMDGKKFWEAGARLEFELVRRTANIYLGYRKVRAEFTNGTEATIDSGGHVGVRISF